MLNELNLEGTIVDKDPSTFGPTSDPFINFPFEFEFTNEKGTQKGLIKVVAKKKECPSGLKIGTKLKISGQLEKPQFLGKNGEPMSAYQLRGTNVEVFKGTKPASKK